MNETVKRIDEIITVFNNFVEANNDLGSAVEKFALKFEDNSEKNGEIIVLIPRELFSNNLRHFAKEMNNIDELVRLISEILEGKIESAEIKTISTSDPMISLAVMAPTVWGVMKLVEKVLDLWERFEKIRKIRVDIASLRLAQEKDLLQKVDSEMERDVDEKIREYLKEIKEKSKLDVARTNELLSRLEKISKKIAVRLDNGMRIEGDIYEASIHDEDEIMKEISKDVATISEKIVYRQISNEPILGLIATNDEQEDSDLG